MESMILMIGEILMYALIVIALLAVVATVVVALCVPAEWNKIVVFPWEKAERRAAKKKEKAELRARREFWQ